MGRETWPVSCTCFIYIYKYCPAPGHIYKSQLGGTYIVLLLVYMVNVHCDYTSIYIQYIYVYIYICICIYVYIYMYIYICVYICIYIYVYICIYIFMYINLVFLLLVFLHVRCIPQTKFVTAVLSKCVTHAGFVMVAWTLRGIPFQVGNLSLRPDLWIYMFQPSTSFI